MASSLRWWLVPIALCAAVALAACGGGGGKNAKLGAGTEVCGYPPSKIASYQPSGKIIADSGFRPSPNGFGVQNYGNCGQDNLTAAQMYDMFGSQVCLSGSGSSCQLSTVAQQWMDGENKGMSGGHCMGFSVTALRFWSGSLNLKDYGADQTNQLEIKDNPDLQQLIAEDWTYQDLPGVKDNTLTGSPNGILKTLVDTLGSEGKSNRSSAYPSSKGLYTIGIYRVGPEGPEGHAVTPYAVEEKGNGQYAVLIYDNNYPGVTQAMSFDANANTWSYNAQKNPGQPPALYHGDATNPEIQLMPTAPGEVQQPCTFCEASSGSSNGAAAVVKPATRYNKITLSGDPANHAHLILKDDKGRLTGFVDGKLVNHIPGVKIAVVLTAQLNKAPEPSYYVPQTTDVIVQVNAEDLKKPDKEELTLIGPGFYTDVSDIKLVPGERDGVAFSRDGRGFAYSTDPRHDQSPILTTAIADKNAAYAIAAKAFGVKGGSTLVMYMVPEKGTVVVDTSGTTGSIRHTGGYAVYDMSVVRETPQGESTWVIGKTPILMKKDWSAVVNYAKAPAAGKELPVFTGPHTGKSPLPVQFLVPSK